MPSRRRLAIHPFSNTRPKGLAFGRGGPRWPRRRPTLPPASSRPNRLDPRGHAHGLVRPLANACVLDEAVREASTKTLLVCTEIGPAAELLYAIFVRRMTSIRSYRATSPQNCLDAGVVDRWRTEVLLRQETDAHGSWLEDAMSPPWA